MGITLDGQNLFDEQELEILPGGLSRDSIERTVAGLDGVLSIDLGKRSRKIKQTGVLQAESRTQMNEKINTIASYLNGDTHTLVRSNGESMDALRMDTFKVSNERTSGNGFCCDYEIIYTQLKI